MSRQTLIRELIKAAAKQVEENGLPLAERLAVRGEKRTPLLVEPKVYTPPAGGRGPVAAVRQKGSRVVNMPVGQYRRLAVDPNRGRPSPERVAAMAADIKQNGLRDLPTLASTGTSDGRARVAALESLGYTHAPVRLLDDLRYGIFAGHGSPHIFDRFDLRKIGTGEGAQVYGHGLYFADTPTTYDRHYRRNLAGNPNNSGSVSFGGDLVRGPHGDTALFEERFPGTNIRIGDVADNVLSHFGQTDDLHRLYLNDAEDLLRADRPIPANVSEAGRASLMENNRMYGELAKQKAELLDKYGDMFSVKAPGASYEVGIRAKPQDLLDWDNLLSEQPDTLERLQDAYDVLSPRYKHYDKLAAKLEDMSYNADEYTGKDVYHQLGMGIHDADVSKFLRDEAGIPGLRYKDGWSRGLTDDHRDVTRNYVIFDDGLIDILRRYQKGGFVE